MRRLRGIAALVLSLALVFSLAGCGAATADVVARVNGDDITRAEFDRLYQQVAMQFGGTIPEEQAPEYRRMLLDMMIESMLIRQEAERLGADLSDEAVDAGVTAMMGETTDTAAFEQRIVEAGLTMEDLRSSIKESISRDFLSEYAASQAEATTLPETYTLLEHILVADEAVAKDLRAQIDAGGDFAALAKEKSTDPGSAAQGGSLGWAPTRAYVTEFADAAAALGVGEISDPIKSDYGWHIIRKVDERAAGSSLADAPAELTQQIEASGTDLALEEYVVGLREAAEIEYLDDTLAPVATP